jgi:Rrf2 family cysteine metabolism transcriptional repressor
MKLFLNVPKKVHHGLLLVTELAAAKDGELLSLEGIAERAGISQGFLEAIAASLRKAGIIRGQRGSGGGYALAVAPETLVVADLVVALGGPLALADCLDGGCTHKHCPSRGLWRLVQMQLVGTLRKLTLADLITEPEHAIHVA